MDLVERVVGSTSFVLKIFHLRFLPTLFFCILTSETDKVLSLAKKSHYIVPGHSYLFILQAMERPGTRKT